ncbi:MAG: MJ1477/TM1410 family putative glycoside hydrolase [Hyphomicrobiaceae bacterium]
MERVIPLLPSHCTLAFPVRTLFRAVVGSIAALTCLSMPVGYAQGVSGAQSRSGTPSIVEPPRAIKPPAAQQAKRPPAAPQFNAEAARTARLSRINAVKSWGYQLASLSLASAQSSPYGMLIVDATTGLDTGKPFTRDEVERLKRAPDGSRRLVISYLSVGESEDYRAYYDKEYEIEEAPDWMMKENPQWKGNRLIRFCEKGWQNTILGDENGRSFYADEPSPLYRLLELGFDGVYLDRVDVYAEITKECPDGANKMVDFVSRLAAHARKRDPEFIVILQNAEELLAHSKMIDAIDAVAKESAFYGADMSQNKNPAAQVRDVLANLRLAKSAGRAVFVIDYVNDRARNADAVSRIKAEGFVPYIGPRNLDRLWLPGVQF